MLDAADKARSDSDFKGQAIEAVLAAVRGLDGLLSSSEPGDFLTDKQANLLAAGLIECLVRLFDRCHDDFVNSETDELRLALKRFTAIRTSLTKRRTARQKQAMPSKDAEQGRSNKIYKQEAHVEMAQRGTKPAEVGETDDPRPKADIGINPDQREHAAKTRSESVRLIGSLKQMTLFILLVLLAGLIAGTLSSALTQRTRFVGLSTAMSHVLMGSGLIQPKTPLPLGNGLILHYENGTITRCEVRPRG